MRGTTAYWSKWHRGLRAAIRKVGCWGETLTATRVRVRVKSENTLFDREIQVEKEAVEFKLMEWTHTFLDRFYILRVDIRVLIG